jgi:hypothetical protein
MVTATIPSSSCTTNSFGKKCTNTIICVSSSPVHDTCSYVVLHLNRVSKSDLILPNLVPFSIAIKIEDDMCCGGMNMLRVHVRYICVSSSPVHDTFSICIEFRQVIILPIIMSLSIAIKIQVAIEDDMCCGGMNMLRVHLRHYVPVLTSNLVCGFH